MSTDTEVRVRGVRALVDALGPVEAERFITLMLREPFDYTNWQRQLWIGKSVDDISKAAMELRRAAPGRIMEPIRYNTPWPFKNLNPSAIPEEVLLAFERGVNLTLESVSQNMREKELVEYLCEGFKDHFGENVSIEKRQKPNIRFEVSKVSGIDIDTIAVEARRDFNEVNVDDPFVKLLCEDAYQRLPTLSDDLKIIVYLADYQMLKRISEEESPKAEKRANECRIVLKYLESYSEFRIKRFVEEMDPWVWRHKDRRVLFDTVLNQDKNTGCLPILRQKDASGRFCIAILKVISSSNRKP